MDTRTETENKATRALYGSIAMVVINAIIQLVGLYLRK